MYANPKYKENLFTKIWHGKIPSTIICENEHAMSFFNINPISETSILIIPKGEFIDWHDFSANAGAEMAKGFNEVCSRTMKELGISENYNKLTNVRKGPVSEQSIFHYHEHIWFGKLIRGISENQKKPARWIESLKNWRDFHFDTADWAKIQIAQHVHDASIKHEGSGENGARDSYIWQYKDIKITAMFHVVTMGAVMPKNFTCQVSRGNTTKHLELNDSIYIYKRLKLIYRCKNK
ncbi:MAG: HIT domain-containing protein [Alphaproteobacteria bacterium]|nr:HIT domain-containing protein [Alphaproteobacteria bacterium]